MPVFVKFKYAKSPPRSAGTFKASLAYDRLQLFGTILVKNLSPGSEKKMRSRLDLDTSFTLLRTPLALFFLRTEIIRFLVCV